MRLIGFAIAMALVAMTATAAAAGGGRPVVSDVRVGPLRLDHARRAAIVRFAGGAGTGTKWLRQYDCNPRSCYINYFLRSAGRMRGKLVAVVLGRGRFATRSGIAIGMSRSRALRREPHGIRVGLCGIAALRDMPLSANPADPWIGLNVLFNRTRVSGFAIFGRHVKVTCLAGGGFRIWN
jgi:hypothetical protein